MKRVIEKEVTICDKCNKETYVRKCLKCGVEHCWDCRQTEGVEYTHSVWSSGSGDGYYCNKCDTELKKTHSDKLHSAYLTIEDLGIEYNSFIENYDKRAKTAESVIKELIK